MGLTDFGLAVVLPALSGAGAGWALIHFFGQRLVDHRLAKDLDRYREELKENTEVLKSQLSIYAHEQSVAISRVDSQRSEAIKNVYACMRSVINPITSIMVGSPIVDGTPAQSVHYYLDHAEDAHKSVGVLTNKLADLAIYFDNETYKKVAVFAKATMYATGVYLDQLRPLVANGRSAEDILASAEQGRLQVKTQFETAIKSVAAELTGIFRIQLGIERATDVSLPTNS